MYTAIGVNVLSSLALSAIIWTLFYKLQQRKMLTQPLKDLTQKFDNAVMMAEHVRVGLSSDSYKCFSLQMPISGVKLMTDVARIPRQKVKDEFLRDRNERSVTVFEVLQKNDTTRRYIDWPHNKYLKQGYHGEAQVLGCV